MPITYKHDDTTPVVGHLRRRSSVTSFASPSPFITQMVYDERTGEIALPSSPPLLAWRDKNDSLPEVYYEDEKKGRLPPYSWPTARGSSVSIRRPWLSVVILACATFAFIVVLFFFSPVARSYNSALLSRIPYKAATACEPYSAFGSLAVDPTDPDKNQWVPFDPTCSPPSFLSKLRNDQSGSSSDFAWLRNRTALLIGDSVSREHVENFCQLLGEQSEVVRKSHKFSPSPSPVRAATKSGHSIDKPARLNTRGYRVVRDASLPRICYIPKYDFMLVSVFHFGLDQEDFWRGSRMPQYAAPGMFEHRLSDVIQPLINNLRAAGRTSAPDFVEVSSAMWDLARWAGQDIEQQQETETGLTLDRVTWYRFRVGQMLERVRKAFPDVKAKTWRTMHYPLDQDAEHDYFMDKIAPIHPSNRTDSPANPYFAHNRIYQLDQAARSLIRPVTANGVTAPAPHSDYRLNEWGPILKGHEPHQKDRLHGDPLPGGYVWADIMLYELYTGVRASEAQPLRTEQH